MDSSAIEAAINEKIQRLQDLNKQMDGLTKQIGSLQEQGRALHGAALEVRGAINALADLKAKEDDKAAAAKKSLILPDKSLVAPDGKTPIAAAPETAPVAENTPANTAPEAEKAPVLDVVK